jgi:peroxiredoxin
MRTFDSGEPLYIAFWLYRLDPSWRRRPASDCAADREATVAAIQGAASDLLIRGIYSLVGLRHDADLLFWVIGPRLDAFQRLAAAINRAPLGGYLEQTYNYIAVVVPSQYDPEHRPSFLKGEPPKAYLSMYPFVKTPEWYLLPFEQRRALMAEHGRLGRRYTHPETGEGVRTNTVHSFGLDDQEFVVAFEGDDPVMLERMVEDLRATEVRRYTQRDTPIFLARLKPLAEALADLG